MRAEKMEEFMKRIIRLAILAVPAAAMILISCRPQKKDTSAGTSAAQRETVVKASRVTRRRIAEKMAYTGTIDAWKKISIMPENGGQIARINVREGESVKQGQILAELDAEAIRLQLQQAEAGVAVAQANANDSRKNKERMDRLIKENAVSEQQAEQVTLGYEAAEAQLRQAQAALNLARHALDVSIMKAPWNGIIASKNAEVGDVINPMMGSFGAASGVLTLLDYSKIKVVIEVSQNAIRHIRKGQPVFLRTPSVPGREFSGEVTIVNLAADPATKKFRVETAFANSGLELRPGTFGNVVFEINSHEEALAVPQKAILDNSYVFIVQNGKAVKREVAVGIQNTALVEIMNGVVEGDLVIVEGNFGLEEGTPVRVAEEVSQ